MGMRELEAGILRELRKETKNNKLRQKDIMEWSTSEVKAQAGERLYYLPDLKINVAIKETT
jgi:hypothetical protein